MRFWETNWRELAPGDEIQAKDGTVWLVGSAITFDGTGEWEISNAELGSHMWTEQSERATVLARRPSMHPSTPGHMKTAEALLTNILGAERVSTSW